MVIKNIIYYNGRRNSHEKSIVDIQNISFLQNFDKLQISTVSINYFNLII